ncbi:MAG: amidase [Candidatus Binatus sp.]
MAFNEYATFDGLALGRMVRERKVTPADLMEAAIARAEKHNGKLNAIVFKDYDRALASARDRRAGTAPFEGVPMLLKDIMGDCAGMPTRSACAFIPATPMPADSEVVARYKRAGFIPFAKTNAPELGIPPVTESRLYGPARNPWNLERTPGGSSGGSAAAVAAGIVPVAHGNDGGGSIRIPAACCGLVGLKPTRGRISLAPNLGDVLGGLIVEHVLTRTVRDCAAALDATAGAMPGDPYFPPPPVRPYMQEASTPPKRLRIAFSTDNPLGGKIHPDCVDAAKAAAKLCAELGHEVEEAMPQLNYQMLAQFFDIVYTAGVALSIEGARMMTGAEPTADKFQTFTWNMYQKGAKVSASQYMIAQVMLQQASRQFAAFFESHDLFLTPTLGQPPLRIGAIDFMSPNTTLLDQTLTDFAIPCPVYNITGQPAISLPLHWNQEGIPIGAMFGARYGDETTLIQLAGQLEQAQPWIKRKPPLWD